MKKRIGIAAILLLVTAVLVFIYLRSRDTVKPGDLLIKSAGGDVAVTFEDLNLTHVTGEITNKKGETKTIESEGIALADIPGLAGVSDYSEISVYADDEYNAVLSKDEALVPDKAWLIKNDDSIRLIVFDDPDAKRDVKNVVRVEIK